MELIGPALLVPDQRERIIELLDAGPLRDAEDASLPGPGSGHVHVDDAQIQLFVTEDDGEIIQICTVAASEIGRYVDSPDPSDN